MYGRYGGHLGAQFINTCIPGGMREQDITSQGGISLVNRANGLSMLRWRDLNGDGLVQSKEITVESSV